jgi:hypothetical protein
MSIRRHLSHAVFRPGKVCELTNRVRAIAIQICIQKVRSAKQTFHQHSHPGARRLAVHPVHRGAALLMLATNSCAMIRIGDVGRDLREKAIATSFPYPAGTAIIHSLVHLGLAAKRKCQQPGGWPRCFELWSWCAQLSDAGGLQAPDAHGASRF